MLLPPVVGKTIENTAPGAAGGDGAAAVPDDVPAQRRAKARPRGPGGEQGLEPPLGMRRVDGVAVAGRGDLDRPVRP
jgi:hypothetical protein